MERYHAPPGGTSPSGINPAGAITGSYWDASGVHGFLRIGTEISLSATSLSFPAQNVGTTIARVIVVTNHGSVPVYWTGVAASRDLRDTELCSCAPPNCNCLFFVVSSPTETGLRTG